MTLVTAMSVYGPTLGGGRVGEFHCPSAVPILSNVCMKHDVTLEPNHIHARGPSDHVRNITVSNYLKKKYFKIF